MKKIYGWLLILVCSFLLLSTCIVTGLIVKSIVIDGEESEFLSDGVSSLLGFLVMIALFVYGITTGIKKVRSAKKRVPLPYNDSINLNLKGSISFVDYRNFLLGQTFKRPTYFVLGAMMLLMLSAQMGTGELEFNSTSGVVIFIFVFMLIMPLITIMNAKQIYNANKYLNEPIEYQIDNNHLAIKGSSFDSVIHWNHFVKIKETKTFFVLYQDKILVTLISKKLLSPTETIEFRTFLRSLPVEIAE